MRIPFFSTDPLLRLLRGKSIATLPDLQRALGSQVPLTVFRKLKQLGYRTSYSHRGRFYTLDRIAREILRLETLETRRRDRLDFHDLAVWQIKDALQAAYKAGAENTPRERRLTRELKKLIARSTDIIDALDGTICDGEPEFLKLRKAVSSATKALKGGAA